MTWRCLGNDVSMIFSYVLVHFCRWAIFWNICYFVGSSIVSSSEFLSLPFVLHHNLWFIWKVSHQTVQQNVWRRLSQMYLKCALFRKKHKNWLLSNILVNLIHLTNAISLKRAITDHLFNQYTMRHFVIHSPFASST